MTLIYADFPDVELTIRFTRINALDMIVNEVVILELKACGFIANEHEIQLQNYLKASKIELGFILNFGPKPKFTRMVFSNDKKYHT